jgi:hypothetical protein
VPIGPAFQSLALAAAPSYLAARDAPFTRATSRGTTVSACDSRAGRWSSGPSSAVARLSRLIRRAAWSSAWTERLRNRAGLQGPRHHFDLRELAPAVLGHGRTTAAAAEFVDPVRGSAPLFSGQVYACAVARLRQSGGGRAFEFNRKRVTGRSWTCAVQSQSNFRFQCYRNPKFSQLGQWLTHVYGVPASNQRQGPMDHASL